MHLSVNNSNLSIIYLRKHTNGILKFIFVKIKNLIVYTSFIHCCLQQMPKNIYEKNSLQHTRYVIDIHVLLTEIFKTKLNRLHTYPLKF